VDAGGVSPVVETEGVLEGTLLHAETGAPLGGIPVRVYSSTEETVVARGRTGEDGVYQFQEGALGAGTYRVVFSGDHWWESGTSWDTATDMKVSAAQPARLDSVLVPTTATLWGDTILHDGGGLTDVQVDVFHADTGELVATAVSDWGTGTGDPVPGIPCSGYSEGCYQIDLPAGDVYTVRAHNWPSWGMADGGYQIELPPGDRRVDLFLPHNAWFVGRVVDGDGAPIAGARVLAIPSRPPIPPHPEESTTGGDGRFTVRAYPTNDPVTIPNASYWLLVIRPDGTATLAGMVDGDPATATEFSAEIEESVDTGDIVLSSP
jgi:5-hydroxyisourate hydrolase-like protein (transthyretin family)